MSRRLREARFSTAPFSCFSSPFVLSTGLWRPSDRLPSHYPTRHLSRCCNCSHSPHRKATSCYPSPIHTTSLDKLPPPPWWFLKATSSSLRRRDASRKIVIVPSTGRNGVPTFLSDNGPQASCPSLARTPSIANCLAVREDYSADGDAWSRTSGFSTDLAAHRKLISSSRFPPRSRPVPNLQVGRRRHRGCVRHPWLAEHCFRLLE